jgi:hypothetical protein
VSVPPTGDAPFDPHDELAEEEWDLVREAVRAVIGQGEEPPDLESLAAAAPVAAAFDGLDVAAAADRVETLRWALLDVDEAFRAADGRILDRGRLVDGLTLTRRVTAAELDSGRLELRHDLSPLHMIDEDALPMVAGDAVVELPSREELDRTTGQLTWRLRLPAGALDGVEADQLVALRWSDGVLSLEPVDGPFDAGSVPEVLRETRAALVAQVDRLELHDGEIVEVGDLVLAALARDAAAFRQPVPPLSELLPLAGLSSHGDFVADGDFDWDRWRDQRHAIGELHRLQYAHDLDRDEAALVYATLQLLRRARKASRNGSPARLRSSPSPPSTDRACSTPSSGRRSGNGRSSRPTSRGSSTGCSRTPPDPNGLACWSSWRSTRPWRDGSRTPNGTCGRRTTATPTTRWRSSTSHASPRTAAMPAAPSATCDGSTSPRTTGSSR